MADAACGVQVFRIDLQPPSILAIRPNMRKRSIFWIAIRSSTFDFPPRNRSLSAPGLRRKNVDRKNPNKIVKRFYMARRCRAATKG
jgi:hypothetical protein